jgi:hypothetical protein
MGSTNSSIIEHRTVADIPQGTSPPSVNQVQQKIVELSCLFTQQYDPLDIKKCTENCYSNSYKSNIGTINNNNITNTTTIAENIRDHLSCFELNEPAFSEKTYKFQRQSAPEVWISSTKNSDHTISYWFQYPILPFHIQAALLVCMELPITQENLSAIVERYKPIYIQLLKMNEHEVSKCEQVEPLFVDVAIKSLLSRNYHAHYAKGKSL